MPCAATWIQLETIIPSEIKSERKDKYHMVSPYVKSKIWHKMNLSINGNRVIDRDQGLGCQGEGLWEEWELEAEAQQMSANIYRRDKQGPLQQ